jgi:hypothetical protein
VSERIQRAVSFAITSGYQLEKGAFDFLETMSQTEDPVKLMEEAVKRVEVLSEKPLFINRNKKKKLNSSHLLLSSKPKNPFSVHTQKT